MSNRLNKHFLLVLALFLVFILIPSSFAGDLNDTQVFSSGNLNDAVITDNGNVDNNIYVSTEGDDDKGDGSESNPYASISKAVDKFNSSVNSNIFIKNGNYVISDTIILNKTINIAGESSTGVILDGNYQNYLFKVTNKATISLSNLTLMNGNSTGKGSSYSDYPAGAIYLYYANALNVDNCRFIDNMQSALSFYGSYTETVVTITNSLFENNKATSNKPGHGGAIYFFGPGILNVTNTTFKNNFVNASYGNGGAVYLGGNNKLASFNNCKFINNTAGSGGAIGAYCAGDIIVSNCIFEDNIAHDNKGSCIYDNQRNQKFLTLSLENNVYRNNSPENNTIYTEGNVNLVDLETNTRITATDISMWWGEDENFTVTLTDKDGNPLAGEKIIIDFTDSYKKVTTFIVTTNSQGQVILSLKNQHPGIYTVLSRFEGSVRYNSTNVTNSVKIMSKEEIDLILDQDYVKMTEGDSVIITGYIVDSYWEITNAFDGKEFYVLWKTHSGAIHTIRGGMYVQDGKISFDLSNCHLSTQDDLYQVSFIIETDDYGDYNATVNVDMSVIMPPVPEDIKIIYVSKDGDDVNGTGSESNPLASVQMALYVNSKLGGGKTIMVKGGVYDISVYTLYDDVNIIGEYNKTIFRQTTGKLGMFMIDQGTKANFTNITFINGYTTPTPYSLLTIRYNSIVNINNCIFRNNTCLNGGAIAVSQGAVVNINNSIFINNKAIMITSEGGAIWVWEATLNIYNSLFYNNTACDGGAIYLNSGSLANIVNTTFDNNTAYKTTLDIGGGGAIYASSYVIMNIDNSTFVNNYADLTAGAIYLSGSNVTITKSYFENNYVKNDGTQKGTDIGSDQTYPVFLNVTYSVFISKNSYLSQVVFSGYGQEYYIDIDGNYWGSNSKGRASVPIHNWIIIEAETTDSIVEVGSTQEITIKFKLKSQDGIFDLAGSVHDFKVDLTPILNTVNPSTVTIVNNVAKTNYTATKEGSEKINFTNINGGVVYIYSFDVEKHIDKINSTLITGNLVMYYLDGSKFVVTLFDANGNPIVNAIVKFTINGVTYERTTNATGMAALNITLIDGLYDISSVFEGNRYYLPSKTINNTILVKPVDTLLTLTAQNIFVGGEEVIIAKINATEGVVLFTINGATQYVDVIDGVAILRLNNLAEGTYTVTAKYDKFKGYLGSQNTTSFSVFKVDKYTFDVSVNDINVGENAVIDVILPEDATGDVVAIVNGVNYTGKANNGSAKIIISDLTEGKYDVVVVYSGDNKYVKTNASLTFTVSKINNYEFNVSVKDAKVGEDAVIDVVLPEDATGDVVAIVNGVNYTGKANNGSAKIIISDLSKGNYEVNVIYMGDDKYTSTNMTTALNIDRTSVNLTVVDLIKYFHGSDRLVAILLDGNGNPIANMNVTFIVNGVKYIKTTDNNGSASMAINLAAGVYNITTKFDGTKDYDSAIVNSTITVKATAVGENIVKMFRNGTQYYALFLDSNGNPLANITVKFNINGVFYYRNTTNEGVARLNINLLPGTYIITNYNLVTGEENSNNVTVKSLFANDHDLVKYYKNDSQYSLTVYGKDGKLAANQEVTFNINGVFYKRVSDDNGIVTLKINLNPGSYIITAEYEGCRVSNNITVKSTLLTQDLTMNHKDGSTFNATALDEQGNPLAGQTITFNVNGVFYNKVTDENGIASLNINLNKGEYIITSMWNNYQIGNKITIA